MVAELSHLMTNMSPETDDANPTGLDPDAVDARLILASPDLLAELKRCYERLDWLQQVADLAADNIGRKNWDGFEEAMYEAGLWERPSE